MSTKIDEKEAQQALEKGYDKVLVSDIQNQLGISRGLLYKYFKGADFCKLHHQLVLFGRYYCKAKNPECLNCKLNSICKKK